MEARAAIARISRAALEGVERDDERRLARSRRRDPWRCFSPPPREDAQSGDATRVPGHGPEKTDFTKLRLNQDFHNTLGVKKALVTVPVRRPNRQEFVRVHPDVNYQLATAILELQEEREMYLVATDLWPDLSHELSPRILFAAMNRQGVLFLWPVRLPGPDGRIDPWSDSALQAARLASTRWIRMASNRSLGAYDIFEAPVPLPDPEWPDIAFKEILHIAFRDRFIETFDHPVLRRLKGVS